MKGERLEWVDVARGIGIVAVVAAHVWTRGPVRDALYSFHMPLFFLLSGALTRPQPVARFAWRQVAGQMRPYFAFLALLILADQIIEPLKGNRPIFTHWPQDLIPILLGGTWLRGPYTIFWFVPCLMAGRILFNALLSRWSEPRQAYGAMAAGGSLLVAYGAGWATDISPMGLLTVPMAFFLLWVGAAWQRTGWRRWMIVPLAALSLCGLAGIFPTLNMKAGDYGWPLLSMLSAIATSILIFRLSPAVPRPFARPLIGLGQASLVIMYLHVAFIHYLTPYLGKPWLFAIALMVPFLTWHLIRRSRRASRIFL
ncbi:acyltransferase family protein [Sphingobium cloacae]|uniref:Glycosyl transferase n=1 Tax=Sphingobium cloacae TaxID=120107 RepID=A0A1E1F0L9_9SPHN|nr:acyltransferase family protein [Sphingobium cloacae]BAV64053.1 glycosyl transferase [Sphingobium cloacae]